MIKSNVVGIVADDLTGANDTSLQFFEHGANTEILLDYQAYTQDNGNVDVLAVSTESRNIDPQEAGRRTFETCLVLKNRLNVECFYKKIDSTLRGNVAYEILSALEATEKDCAVIVPAFVQEGRTTVGGFQLVKGLPIERTEAARDPHRPIKESNIVNILRKQMPEEDSHVVDLIDFSTVSKGAAPIVLKLNELIAQGKKLIVIDAMSVIDIEQIVLAIKKCSYDILPCGSAGMAQALAKYWFENCEKEKEKEKITIPNLPRFMVSGSANKLSDLQIKKLEEDSDKTESYFISLKTEDILKGVQENLVKDIAGHLNEKNIVAVHLAELTAELEDENSKARESLIDEGITRYEFAHKITDYLAQLVKEVNSLKDFILITIGGETSFKCAKSLSCESLKLIDTIIPAVPLCLCENGQYIVTKSGNLGTLITLNQIMRYFDEHE